MAADQPVSRDSVTKVVVPGAHDMVSLLGQRDELLRVIEKAFSSDIHVRGNEITITGDEAENELAARLFEELIALLERGDVLDGAEGRAQPGHAARRRRRPSGRRADAQHPVQPRPHDPARRR